MCYIVKWKGLCYISLLLFCIPVNGLRHRGTDLLIGRLRPRVQCVAGDKSSDASRVLSKPAVLISGSRPFSQEVLCLAWPQSSCVFAHPSCLPSSNFSRYPFRELARLWMSLQNQATDLRLKNQTTKTIRRS